MHDLLETVDHRPWPLPDRPWMLHMAWRQLLFAHWPVDRDRLRELVPRSLPLDAFEGDVYIGVVPFLMDDVHPRWLPKVPGLSRFPELNVRTYVSVDGKPGVFFFSLDAASRVAVRVARRAFHLPYFDARMNLVTTSGTRAVDFASRRVHRNAPSATFRARYAAAGAERLAEPGSLDQFLTERYAFYTTDSAGRVLRCDIHHAPWPLQPARADIATNTLLQPLELQLPDAEPLLHYADALHVLAWLPEEVQA